MISGTAPSAWEIRHAFFAARAVSWKPASSIPGTRPTVTRSIFVIANPSPCLRIWTFASVLIESAFVPPSLSMWANCIE